MEVERRDGEGPGNNGAAAGRTRQVDRTVLPIEHADPFSPVAAPDGAPNVVVVLIDDMGFGASSAFGGPCAMPAAERVAAGGLRYSRFHVTALCSPTRQALLTGRNHHSVGMGSIVDMATSAPGYTSVRPRSAVTLARTLVENGYSTAAFGKMHQTPPWEAGPMGPFERWPTGEGFEKFYGFIGPETNHWNPLLYDGTRQLSSVSDGDPEYHLSEDLVDQAISWVRSQRALTPERPFFLYLPFGATHAPIHVAPDWRKRYEGRFDEGWDRERETIFARQKRDGLIPADAELPAWTPGVPHWDELTAAQRRVAAAMMEAYAGFAEHADAQVGRLIDVLTEAGALDNTILYYILGDNGASAEGGLEGTLSEFRMCNSVEDSAEYMLDRLDDLGTERSYPSYPAGWALAMNTPYRWAKQVASHYGGTRNGLIVHWPRGIVRGDGLRHQWHHVIDVAPTLLDAIGIPHPVSVDGTPQQPIEGTSMAYTFRDADAADRKTVQYFEMLGNRGIYADGWMAGAKHRTPWVIDGEPDHPFDADVWELYHVETDWTQARDLAATHPDKLAELKGLFRSEAEKHNVFPLDDRMMERHNPALAGRPDVLNGRTSVTFAPGGDRLPEEVAPNVKNRSFAATARVTLTDASEAGVLVAQGGRFGGWALYMVAGVPAFTYNCLEIETVTVDGDAPLDPGDHELAGRFAYDGGGVGRGGAITLVVDGRPVARGRIERTVPYWFGPDDAFDVGRHHGTAVSPRYEHTRGFSGQLHAVRIDLEPEDTGRGLPEHGRYQSALARQ